MTDLRGRFKVGTVTGTAPITTAEVKTQMRLTTTADDALIDDLVLAAIEIGERYLGRKLPTQTAEYWLDTAPYREPMWDGLIEGPRAMLREGMRCFIELPWLPVVSVQSILYYNDGDTESTWSTDNYRVDTNDPNQWARIVLKRSGIWPINLRPNNAIKVNYTLGYGNAAAVPAAIKRGLIAIAVALYHASGDCSEEVCLMKSGAASILNAYRVKRVV